MFGCEAVRNAQAEGGAAWEHEGDGEERGGFGRWAKARHGARGGLGRCVCESEWCGMKLSVHDFSCWASLG